MSQAHPASDDFAADGRPSCLLIGLYLSCRLAARGRAPRRSFETHGGTQRGRESRGRVTNEFIAVARGAGTTLSGLDLGGILTCCD